MPANFWYDSKPIFIDFNKDYANVFGAKPDDYEESSESNGEGNCSGSDLDQDRDPDDEFFTRATRRVPTKSAKIPRSGESTAENTQDTEGTIV